MMFSFCWHKWGPSEFLKTVSLYERKSDSLPYKQFMLYQHTCQKCGKVKNYRAKV